MNILYSVDFFFILGSLILGLLNPKTQDLTILKSRIQDPQFSGFEDCHSLGFDSPQDLIILRI